MSTTPAIIIGLQDALRLSQHVASPEGGKLPVWSLKEAAARLSEMDAEIKRLKSEVEFLHLRRGQLVIERDKAREALADLTSWFTLPMISGKVWIIPAGERGADDAVNAARAALEHQQKEDAK